MTSQTILLVGDDSDPLRIVGEGCRSIGLNVQHARNLRRAMAVIDRFVPDVVCVDVEMPTGNGLQLCELLAADPLTVAVPIIVLTGRRDVETRQKFEQIGAHCAFKSADIWATLEPLVRRLMPQPSQSPQSARPRATTGIRPRNLPARLIPNWPAEADDGDILAADAGESAHSVARRKVVVADDDNDLVQMLSERFNSLGCSAIGVHTSLDAINVIHRVQPELVILDVNMPTGSGLSVCEMMATDSRLRFVPVIILTGCADEKTIRRCHDMLVFYVQKGADIWSRIDPLVRELLHLDDAPLPIGTLLTTPTANQRTNDVGRPPKSAAAIGGDERESLLDAVFAMLGADADADATADVGDPQGDEPYSDGAREVVEMPWVLSIDDDSDFADALEIRFEEYGVALARAANGLAGFRMAFSTPARAILLDYQMPNGQGDYILDRLKTNPVTRDIPVFMITGIKDKVLERRVMAMGAAGYFLKPIDFEKLRERLAEYIGALAQPLARLTEATR